MTKRKKNSQSKINVHAIMQQPFGKEKAAALLFKVFLHGRVEGLFLALKGRWLFFDLYGNKRQKRVQLRCGAGSAALGARAGHGAQAPQPGEPGAL